MIRSYQRIIKELGDSEVLSCFRAFSFFEFQKSTHKDYIE